MAPSGPEEHQMFARQVHALAVGVSLLVVAFVIAVIVGVRPTSSVLQGIDDRWLRRMTAVRTPWLTSVSKVMSRVGGTTVTLPVRIAVVGVLAVRRRWLQLGAFVGATISSELCIGPLKALVDRPRPPGGLIATSATSFPSGHAVAGAVTAFGVVVVFMHATPRRLLVIGLAAAFAGLMALSRTYLAVHWLSDVVAGVCIGTGMALVWPAALGLARDRHRRRTSVGTSR